MNKIVSRVLVVVSALAVVLSMFAMADASEGYVPTDPTCGLANCQHIDPATANNGAFGFQDINPTAAAGAVAAGGSTSGGTVGGTGGGTSGGIAITGAETDIPLAIGVGLLALGGTALVASRKGDNE